MIRNNSLDQNNLIKNIPMRDQTPTKYISRSPVTNKIKFNIQPKR